MSKNHAFETGRNKRSKKAVVFDLDGTLADTNDPNANHKKDHQGFRSHAAGADAIPEMVEKVRREKDKGRDVVILTARSAHYRKDTKTWLNEHGIPYDALYMREVGDDRKDKKVKKSLLKEEVLPNFKVKKAYDDKKKNVKMFRNEGIDAKQA
jgi:FMN phosphatase YigB (HAD superfamily)